MNNINILSIQKQITDLYKHQYFQEIVVGIVLSLAFLFGRLFHQKKFSNLLNMINDAENARKLIYQQKKAIDQLLRKLVSKKYLAVSITAVVILTLATYTYFSKKIQIQLILQIIGTLLIIWAIIWIRIKYLKWKKISLQNKLKQSALTAQNEMKQILGQIGQSIKQSFKYKFERQLENQRIAQQLKECNLSKCYNQKRAYEKLFTLYQEILNQLKKFHWCNICQNQENINILDIKMNELEINFKMFRKLVNDEKFPMQKQKQLTNRMLEQWKNLQPKLKYICKRGCCLKLKQLIDILKNRHFKTLNDLKVSLRNL